MIEASVISPETNSSTTPSISRSQTNLRALDRSPLIQGQDSHKSILRDVHLANGLHAFFALFLLL